MSERTEILAQQEAFKNKASDLGQLGELLFERNEFPLQLSGISPYLEVEWLTGTEASQRTHFDDGHIYYIEGDVATDAHILVESMLVVVNGNLSAKNLFVKEGSLYVHGNLTVTEHLLCFSYGDNSVKEERNLLYCNTLNVNYWFAYHFRSRVADTLNAAEIYMYDEVDSFRYHPSIVVKNTSVIDLEQHQNSLKNNTEWEELIAADCANEMEGYFDFDTMVRLIEEGKHIFENAPSTETVRATAETAQAESVDTENRFREKLKNMGVLGDLFYQRSKFPALANGCDSVDHRWIANGKALDFEETDSGTNYFIDGDCQHDTLVLHNKLTVINGDLKVKNLVINEGALYVAGNLEVENLLYAKGDYWDKAQTDNMLYVGKNAQLGTWVNDCLQVRIAGALEAKLVCLYIAYDKRQFVPVIGTEPIDVIVEFKNKTYFELDAEEIYKEAFMEEIDINVNAHYISEWLLEGKNVLQES